MNPIEPSLGLQKIRNGPYTQEINKGNWVISISVLDSEKLTSRIFLFGFCVVLLFLFLGLLNGHFDINLFASPQVDGEADEFGVLLH